MEATFKRTEDGHIEAVNFFPEKGGALRRREAFTNAVIVQMFAVEQEDGSISYRKFTSIMCRNPEMLPALRAEAKRIAATKEEW